MGFPMRCDDEIKNIMKPVIEKFRSLMGFPMRCDVSGCVVNETRFGFQSLMGFPMRCDIVISPDIATSVAFQSLMGFPMRCDVYYSQSWRVSECGFNPLW